MRSEILLASFDRFGTSLNREIVCEKVTVEPEEGELKFNSMRNTLRRYQNYEWMDITRKVGPGIQR